MSAATATARAQPVLPAPRLSRIANGRLLAPTLLALANGIAFYVVRPGVNDLWAARARASAVNHGVGLGYWFSWFGGGSTPGNYSVLTPYASAAIGTELVGALSAVAIVALATVALRDTRHPITAAWVAALVTGINLWSGRVPFLLGAAFAVGALIALRAGHRSGTVGLTLLSILASPVSGAFIVMGLSGTFLTTRTREYRPIIGYAVVTCIVALGAVGVMFGTPGPESFVTSLMFDMLLSTAALLLAGAPDHLRTTIWLTLFATVFLWAVPNGMGSNFQRFVFFCLPVVVVALSRWRAPLAVLFVLPALVFGAIPTIKDLHNAAAPVSTVGYYDSLVHRLDKISDLRDYRVEVVNHGAHAGYDALLDHAMLARGWETQEDNALNKSLSSRSLDAVTYKVWLDNNAVGYVALPSDSVGGYPEYTLVQKGVDYLTRVWNDDDWQLYRVADPTPIVGAPGKVLGHDQKSMTISVPCGCTIAVRLRWSKFLAADLQMIGPRGKPVDATPTVHARVANDGTGWTLLTTTHPGTYVLRGSLRGLLG